MSEKLEWHAESPAQVIYLKRLSERMANIIAWCADPAHTNEAHKNFHRAMILTELLEFCLVRRPGDCDHGIFERAADTLVKRVLLERTAAMW
jgi:hypothetical protein